MPELAIFSLALAWDETPSWASVEGAASRAEVARWLRHDDHEQAVRELVRLGPTVVPLLLGARNRRGHRRALEALGRLGPAAEPAADAVIADLSHRSGN